uniref:Uncharacterized protein n=1 Tax=Podoviridae sp. ct8Lf7 TaxID=2827723 RepID=A0A8S5S0C3_9CAUD|nr:MAG TPA: hypothetical protein [Podoviridae sp. ct8Lf7]
MHTFITIDYKWRLCSVYCRFYLLTKCFRPRYCLRSI